MFENLSDSGPEEEVRVLPHVNYATFTTTAVTTAGNEEHENDAESMNDDNYDELQVEKGVDVVDNASVAEREEEEEKDANSTTASSSLAVTPQKAPASVESSKQNLEMLKS
eukprot:6319896-Ditylum_brightwellii.AAC.1